VLEPSSPAAVTPFPPQPPPMVFSLAAATPPCSELRHPGVRGQTHPQNSRQRMHTTLSVVFKTSQETPKQLSAVTFESLGIAAILSCQYLAVSPATHRHTDVVAKKDPQRRALPKGPHCLGLPLRRVRSPPAGTALSLNAEPFPRPKRFPLAAESGYDPGLFASFCPSWIRIPPALVHAFFSSSRFSCRLRIAASPLTG